MGKEEMEWHLFFIVYETTCWDWFTKHREGPMIPNRNCGERG